jgi:peptide/nickel transport system permease protein
MLRYIIRRVLYGIVTVLVVLTIAFLILHIIPGDPVKALTGVFSTEESYQRMRESFGLNDPLYVQYFNYIKGIATGDLGKSLRQKEDVTVLIGKYLPYTLRLIAFAISIAVFFSIILGVVSYKKQGTFIDRIIMFVSMIFQSIPSFFLGVIFMLFFAVELKILPPMGTKGFKSIVLPSLALSLGLIPVLIKFIRYKIIEVMKEDFVLSLRSRGIKENVIIYKHVIKNITVPLITIISQQLGNLLAGTFIIETLFNYVGIGFLGVMAATDRDYPLLQGIVIFVAIIFISINIITDIIYTFIDPRISYY